MNYNQRVGKFGEELARNYLVEKGYKIVESNVKISYQEVDIIAKLGDDLIFIEVKTRTTLTFGQADEAVGGRKLNNLKEAVEYYVYEKKHDPGRVRMDLIAIDIDKRKKIAKIKHYRDIA